ncbi:MAG: hypothetical protein AAGC95_13540 [Pseudomonadota bacterium]
MTSFKKLKSGNRRGQVKRQTPSTLKIRMDGETIINTKMLNPESFATARQAKPAITIC